MAGFRHEAYQRSERRCVKECAPRRPAAKRVPAYVLTLAGYYMLAVRVMMSADYGKRYIAGFACCLLNGCTLWA
ncbi:hypothetical protein KCP74_20870 [Salmonella enterica subsp. enterica]|nr:hypothetical protein KCP74_20870 [Salmonella enterica subsp. enterica]